MALVYVVLLGLGFVACIFFGEEVPAGDAPPELLDLDADEGPDNPKGDDAPPTKPDKPADDGEKPDRTSNWQERMAKWEAHIPDEEKQSFRNSVDQGSRWGRGEGSEELDELKGRFSRIDEIAANIREHFDVDEGKTSLEVLDMFAEWTPQELAEAFGKTGKPDEKPPAEGPESELLKRIEKLEAQRTEEAKEAKLQAEIAAFHAEFDPAVEKSVTAFEVAEADKDAVSKSFAKIAGSLYNDACYENRSTATVSAAIKEANDLITLVLDARQSKRPQRPRGQVKVNPDAEKPDTESDSYQEAVDAFDEGFVKDAMQHLDDNEKV